MSDDAGGKSALSAGLGRMALPPVWRLMGRANPFVPWIRLEDCWRLEFACKRAKEWKKRGKFYAVHVRAI